MSARRPWKVEWSDGALHIRDADGNSIMCNERYYPWVPDDREDWDLIVNAVNAFTSDTSGGDDK